MIRVKELDKLKNWKYWSDAKLYVSDCGDFFRYRKRNNSFTKIGKKQQHGYIAVNCNINGKDKQIYGHRIVGKLFITNKIKEKIHINHKNGIRHDNRVENLEWVTPGENNIHSIEVLGKDYSIVSEKLKKIVGTQKASAKLDDEKVVQIRKMLQNNKTCIHISKIFNVNRRTIGDIKNNKSWKHV